MLCDLGDFKSTRTRTTHTHLPTGIIEPVTALTGTSGGSSRRNRMVGSKKGPRTQRSRLVEVGWWGAKGDEEGSSHRIEW